MIAYAKVITATLTDFVILTEDSTALTLAIVMRIVITQRNTARLTRYVVHIRTVTLVSTAVLTLMLASHSRLVASGTIFTIIPAFVMVTLAQSISAYLTEGIVH